MPESDEVSDKQIRKIVTSTVQSKLSCLEISSLERGYGIRFSQNTFEDRALAIGAYLTSRLSLIS